MSLDIVSAHSRLLQGYEIVHEIVHIPCAIFCRTPLFDDFVEVVEASEVLEARESDELSSLGVRFSLDDISASWWLISCLVLFERKRRAMTAGYLDNAIRTINLCAEKLILIHTQWQWRPLLVILILFQAMLTERPLYSYTANQ